jgi:hypothetical protein
MNVILFIILDVFNYPLLGLEKEIIGVEKDIISYVSTVNTGLVEVL